jgi:hypothetical protein
MLIIIVLIMLDRGSSQEAAIHEALGDEVDAQRPGRLHSRTERPL